MRQNIDNGIIFEYADEIGFAFMPCLVMAHGSGLFSLLVEVSGGDYDKSFEVDAMSERAVADYREYVQQVFDGRVSAYVDGTTEYDASNLSIAFNIDVTAKNEAGDTIATLDFAVTYIWGAVNPRETWNGYKHLVWFTHFPFSFPLYISKKGTNVLVGFNGAPQKLLTLQSDGIIDITSKCLSSKAKYSIIYDYDGEIQQATFDNYFDFSFYLKNGGKQTELLRIDFDDTERGIYLRWVDRHGFVRYWLFTRGDETRAATADDEFIRNNLGDWSDVFGYVGANGRRQGHSREDTIPICASFVDSDTYDFLQDLTTSPIVDMYLGGDWEHGEDVWQSVTVKAGSYTKTRAIIQDFICELVLNDTKIQRL